MVGFEGDRPFDMVRVCAENPNYKGLIIRILDLLPREDKANWQVGDEVGLHGSSWKERGDSKVYATITEIINDYYREEPSNP
jgi:hypothetical protein